MAAVYYETVACTENGITNEKRQKGEVEKKKILLAAYDRDTLPGPRRQNLQHAC